MCDVEIWSDVTRIRCYLAKRRVTITNTPVTLPTRARHSGWVGIDVPARSITVVRPARLIRRSARAAERHRECEVRGSGFQQTTKNELCAEATYSAQLDWINRENGFARCMPHDLPPCLGYGRVEKPPQRWS